MSDVEAEVRPKRRFRLRTKLYMALAFLVVVIAAFIMGAVLTHQESQPIITTDLIHQQLAEVQDLTTVEYYYTNMGKFENQLDFYGWQVPFTRKSFIVSYDGIIRAGIDLSGLTVRVSGSTIYVTLPEAKILSHEIPEDSIEVFDETRNIFNPIQISDYTGFTQDQKAEMEARAVENGLLVRASEKASATIFSLLQLMPGMDRYELLIQ